MMLRRDPHSGAVLNADAAALNKYKQERALHRKVESLSKELNQVKATLSRVCERIEELEKS